MAEMPMSPLQPPVDPTFARGAQLGDDELVIDLTGPEPVVTSRPLLVDLRERVDTRVRDGRWALVLALAVLQVLDVLTTHLVLGSGGAEGNPIMQSLVSEGWGGPLLLKLACVGVIAAIVGCCPERSGFVTRGLVVVTGVYGAIIAWNVAVLLALV